MYTRKETDFLNFPSRCCRCYNNKGDLPYEVHIDHPNDKNLWYSGPAPICEKCKKSIMRSRIIGYAFAIILPIAIVAYNWGGNMLWPCVSGLLLGFIVFAVVKRGSEPFYEETNTPDTQTQSKCRFRNIQYQNEFSNLNSGASSDKVRGKPVIIDNTSEHDNWITNQTGGTVTVACTECFGSFTIDLHPGETKRITFDVHANVFPLGSHTYENLKYEIGRCEKWVVIENVGELILCRSQA
jgi:hypothetical protein